jgi:hypothetical protein
MPDDDVPDFYSHMNEISTGAKVTDDGSVEEIGEAEQAE